MTTLVVDKLPVRLDLLFPRGDDFSEPFQFRDGNGAPLTTWSGYTFAAQARSSVNATTAVDFVIDATDKATGLWLLTMPKLVTATLGTTYAWDMERTDDNGLVKTLFAGMFCAQPDVTRAP